jgi:hypothetical protein
MYYSLNFERLEEIARILGSLTDGSAHCESCRC